MTEHQKAVNALYHGWKEDKSITFFLYKDGQEREESVPMRDCLPTLIKLLKKQGWLVIDAEMSSIEKPR